MKDLANVYIKGSNLLISIHEDGSLKVWDMLSQKRVFNEALLADSALETTEPKRIAVPKSTPGASSCRSRTDLALSFAILFAPRIGSSEQNEQVIHS